MSLNIHSPASSGLSTARAGQATTVPRSEKPSEAESSTETQIAFAALLRPHAQSQIDNAAFTNACFDDASPPGNYEGGLFKSQNYVPFAAVDKFASHILLSTFEFLRLHGELLLIQSIDAQRRHNAIEVGNINEKISRFLRNTTSGLTQLTKFLIEDQLPECRSPELESQLQTASKVLRKIDARYKAEEPKAPTEIGERLHSFALGELQQQNEAKKLSEILSMI